MDVYEAVSSRRAVRAFRDEPVGRQVLERVLAGASRAPSSGNLQPWYLFVVSGAPLAELKTDTIARALAADLDDERQYPMYPELVPPYLERFYAAATQRYEALGVQRDDPDRPMRIAALNAAAFGAPVVVFCYLDPMMGPGQWADAGMYLQTVMLLLRAEGLHSCPQVMWTKYWKTVSKTVGANDGMILLCGLAVGHEDCDAPRTQTERASLAETVTFIGEGLTPGK